MTPRDAFFTLHSDLPREGPGDDECVAWAMNAAMPEADWFVCDAGSGPGADIPALLTYVPDGNLLAVDLHAPFVARAAERFAGEPRVQTQVGSMADIVGPFDLIWCAGALYFLGVETGLRCFRKALKEEGVIVFSEPCLYADTPSEADIAFWGGYGGITDRTGILKQVTTAGYDVVADRKLPDAAWEAYYTPMDARVEMLRSGAAEELIPVLDEGHKEAADWRAMKDRIGYHQIVAVAR
jgi:SAM-dependent methyltransferase